jgi:hypothetical protein
MRKGLLLLAIAFMTFVGAGQAFALQGGPDAYGYIWKDSDEPGGPTFQWKEIQNAPGAIEIQGLADDNSVGPFTFNWDFHYYWTDNNKFKFGSNGWVGFNTNISNIASCFPVVPTAGGAGDNFLAPFMSDLTFTGTGNPGEVWWWDNGVDSLIIEWVNAPWWVNTPLSYAGSNTFQMILSGVDSSITYQYKSCDPTAFNNIAQCATDLEIGFENLTGNIGLEISNESVPADSYVVKIYYPSVVTFQVPDATPLWVANSDNAGQFVLAGAGASPVNFQVNAANVGNANITNLITMTATTTPGGVLPGGTTATLPAGLAAGANSTLTFANAANFGAAGSYTLTVVSSNSQDINPSNNTNTVEVVAVECLNDTLNLGYSTSPQPDGVIVWAGGGVYTEGAGLQIIPPSYPVTVEAVDIFIADIDQDPLAVDPYRIFIYDGNGIPGAILDSVNVPSSQIIENTWQRVQLNGTAVITSGSFIIGWLQGGSNVALGTEGTSPISRRTWEIIGSAWSGYRNGTVDDFLLSAHVSTACIVSTTDPKASALTLQAVPNPTQGSTQFQYNLPAAGDVRISVSDLSGKVVFRSDIAGARAGIGSTDFSTSSLNAGLYFVQLEQGDARVSTKLVVVR